MKNLAIALAIMSASCTIRGPHYVLRCEVGGGGGVSSNSMYWHAEKPIRWVPEAQAFDVDGNLVPPGGGICRTWYED